MPWQRAPADEDVGGALDQPFAVDHPRAVVVVAAGLGVGLIYRRPGLLDLQEQRVGAAAALEQHQVDLHPHAAYPHDLADHIDLGEPVEQAPPVLLEGQPVPGEEVVDQVGLFVVADRDADRGILGYPGRPCAIVVSLANAPRLVRRFRFFSMWIETRPRSAGSK